jgi:hypothetical protein
MARVAKENRSLRNFLGASETDRLARWAGLLYFLTLPTAGPWYYMSATLLNGDTATLASLEAGRDSLELVIILGALGHAAQLAAAVVLHRLLRPFGAVAANLMLVLIAVGGVLSYAAMAQQMDALALLDSTASLSALGAEQLQSYVTLTADAYTNLVSTAALFWGLWLLPLGWLLVRCGFVPRVLGVMVFLGAPFYMQAFFGPVLDPAYQTSLAASIVGYLSGIPDLIGELGTAVWLTVMGARARKAAAAAAAPAA